MQLALDTVCSCFPDHYAIRQYGYIRNTLLAYPVLYEESYTWKENLLYIARTDILPKTNLPENMSLICVSRRLPKEWADSNNHIILLLNDTTVFSAFNTVFAIFQDFQNWERRLLTELGKDNDFDIQTFLRLGEEKLQNPISVSDSALRIILTSDTKQQNNPPSIDKTINISADFFPRIQDFCQTERLIKTPYLSQLTSENGIHHYCCNLYPMDYFAGCVWISEVNRPFHNADYSLADFYFSHFQKAYYKFLQMEKTTNKMASCVLKNILDHKLLSSEEEAWLTLEPDEAWMFFRLKAHPLKKPMPLDYMCAMVNILLPDTAYAVIYNNSIRGLWKCKKGTDNTDLQNLQALKELLL